MKTLRINRVRITQNENGKLNFQLPEGMKSKGLKSFKKYHAEEIKAYFINENFKELIKEATADEASLNDTIEFNLVDDKKNSQVSFFGNDDDSFKSVIEVFYINGKDVNYTDKQYQVMENLINEKYRELIAQKQQSDYEDSQLSDDHAEQGLYTFGY